jgi:hypothetical protein
VGPYPSRHSGSRCSVDVSVRTPGGPQESATNFTLRPARRASPRPHEIAFPTPPVVFLCPPGCFGSGRRRPRGRLGSLCYSREGRQTRHGSLEPLDQGHSEQIVMTSVLWSAAATPAILSNSPNLRLPAVVPIAILATASSNRS